MKSWLTLAGLLLVSSVAAQSPIQNGANGESKAEPCKVSGTVVRLGDNTPLHRAIVQLIGMDQHGRALSVQTGEDGKFAVEHILPGQYRFVVSRNGYVPQSYGQKKPGDAAALLSLSPGQTMTDLVFRMVPSAVISGRVQNEDGEPMPWVHMVAYRLEYSDGKRSPSMQAETSTNDLGEYRLFGLTPGRYFVAANYEPGSYFFHGRRSMMGNGELNPGYVPTYYANTSDPAKATSIRVKAGEEINSVDLILSPVHVVRVRGRLYNAIVGATGTGSFVSLQPKDSQLGWMVQERYAFVQSKEGTFEIPNVPPGSYVLAAVWSSEEKSYRARQAVEVGSADVEGLTLTLAPGLEVSGRINWEGHADAMGQLHVILTAVNSQQGGVGARAKPDGWFTLDNVPEGPSRIQVLGIGPDSFVKSVRYGTTESTTEELTVVRGSDATVEITLSSRGAHLEGKVTNSDALPAAGVWVALVPEASHRAAEWLFKSDTTDQNGRFAMRGIAPGTYKMFSWDHVEQGAWQDPDFLKTFESQGQSITIQEGETKAVELVALKAAASEDEDQ
jgi:hypothetical protein